MNRLYILLLVICNVQLAFAESKKTFSAHYRQRPPEMNVDEVKKTFTGPLRVIIEEAAEKIGFSVNWRQVKFKNSYECLQKGCVDIVPRVIMTEERKPFVHYLGPIGHQQKDIVFLVKKGQEDLIKKYEDLYNVTIGTKEKTAYFDRFNKDQKLKKIHSVDDENMSRMFIAGRFEAMIVLDVPSIERALKKNNFSNYSYAKYRYVQKISNYYGMSKKSPYKDQYDKLNQTLIKMVETGRIKDIYQSFGLKDYIH